MPEARDRLVSLSNKLTRVIVDPSFTVVNKAGPSAYKESKSVKGAEDSVF